MVALDEKGSNIQPWTLLESKELYTSKRLSLRQDTCRLPSKRIIDDYLVVTIPDGAALVALTEQQKIVLVKQYKHGLGRIVLELPAGNVEQGEDPKRTIARELMEETGYEASSIEFITTIVSKPARMSARTFIYFAADVKPAGYQQKNDTEIIQIVLVPVKELPSLIQKGEIITETSLAALLMTWNKIHSVRNDLIV